MSYITCKIFDFRLLPKPGVTSERKAPNSRPITPDCRKDVWLWQYARNVIDCAIDTNLTDEEF